MSLEAIRGETGAFDARLHEEGRPYPGQIASARNVKRLLEGSACVTDEGRLAYGGDHGPRVQDAISFRSAPQTHGGARDMASRLCQVAEQIRTGNSTSLLLLELSLDTSCVALADLGTISERRSFRLNDSSLSMGLPMNLTASSSGVNHGFPVLQAVASALVGEMKRLAVPGAALGISGSVAFDLATERLRKSLDLMDGVLAVEIMMAAQGMDLVVRKVPDLTFGRGTGAAHLTLRRKVPFAEKDRFFRDDMESTQALVREGQLVVAAEKAAADSFRAVSENDR
jgi:histidine ammonia-lyase